MNVRAAVLSVLLLGGCSCGREEPHDRPRRVDETEAAGGDEVLAAGVDGGGAGLAVLEGGQPQIGDEVDVFEPIDEVEDAVCVDLARQLDLGPFVVGPRREEAVEILVELLASIALVPAGLKPDDQAQDDR